MKDLLKKFSATFFLLIAFIAVPAIAVPQPAQAQISVCDFIGPVCDAIAGPDQDITEQNALDFITNRGELILGLIFVGITILAVFIIVQAGIKYIQSQGEPDKIEEAQKAIKSVFIGLAILFVGVVGVFILLFALGGSDGFISGASTCEEDCENSPNPITCVIQCENNGSSGGSRTPPPSDVRPV